VIWVTLSEVEAIHNEQLIEHGGVPGVRDQGVLESAVVRAKQKAAYGKRDIATLAAAYAFGIARNHPFLDGNKRTAYVVMRLFLELNGQTLIAPREEKVEIMLRLAAGEISESKFASWIRNHVCHRPRGRAL
jgi:death on curing protein